MGRYAEELARIAATPDYGADQSCARLSAVFEDIGRATGVAASDPGWSGRSADSASEKFVVQMRRARTNADVLTGAVDVFVEADDALGRARAAFEALPVETMSGVDFAKIVAGGWVMLGPFGAFSGLTGARFANAVLDFNREQHAKPIVIALESELEWLAKRLEARTSDLRVPKGARPRELPNFPLDREESSLSPWDVGWEWLSGEGNSREFQEGDEFTELLREHPHYQQLRDDLSRDYDNLYVGWDGVHHYVLSGVDGVGKYVVDYSTLLTGGATGNLAVTYLGSHSVDLLVVGQRPDGGYEVRITVKNESSLESATRPPLIGYENWYQESVGEATRQFSEQTGLGRTTEQTLVWSETIYP